MVPAIEILDADSIDRLPDDAAGRYITALVTAGARSYVDNANVEAKALLVDGKALPLLINQGGGSNGDVCSPYAHYVQYTLEEVGKRHPRLPPRLFAALMRPLAAVLKAGRVDRVAFVNNWLLATNPSAGLLPAQIAGLTSRLTQAYPDTAVVFRTVNPVADAPGAEALRGSGYQLIRSRRVYMLDPTDTRYRRRRNTRDDQRLLQRTSYRIVRDHEALEPQAGRLAALYRDLYLGKHSWLNPQFNERFVRLTLREKLLTYRALEKNGRMDGFIAHFVTDGAMVGALLGYDRQLPRELGLYRMLFAMLMAEAAEQNLLLNLSGGAGHFKMSRGAVPVEEFDAFYDRHLPPRRRLPWRVLQAAAALWALG